MTQSRRADVTLEVVTRRKSVADELREVVADVVGGQDGTGSNLVTEREDAERADQRMIGEGSACWPCPVTQAAVVSPLADPLRIQQSLKRNHRAVTIPDRQEAVGRDGVSTNVVEDDPCSVSIVHR